MGRSGNKSVINFQHHIPPITHLHKLDKTTFLCNNINKMRKINSIDFKLLYSCAMGRTHHDLQQDRKCRPSNGPKNYLRYGGPEFWPEKFEFLPLNAGIRQKEVGTL